MLLFYQICYLVVYYVIYIPVWIGVITIETYEKNCQILEKFKQDSAKRNSQDSETE